MEARRTGSTDSAAATLPNLSAAVVSLLDFSLVYDPEQRPTARALYSHVINTMENSSVTPQSTEPQATDSGGSQDDEIARLRAEIACLRAQIPASEGASSQRPQSARRLDEALVLNSGGV